MGSPKKFGTTPLVHVDDEKYSLLARLIEVSPPLTDDTGFRLINSLLPYILKAAGLGERILVESVRSGGEANVYYLLQLPSGETSIYSGWPDFRLAQNYPAFERRLGRHILREETTRAIGEVQSPPGDTKKVKMAALAQTGIYAIGQFSLLKEKVTEKKRIAAILLYKDMTIHVAIATLDPFKGAEGSMGEVGYKLVDSIVPYDLRNEADLGQFASVFVSVLQETLVSILPGTVARNS